MLIHINDKMAFICPQRAGHTTASKIFPNNAKFSEWMDSNKQKVVVIRNPLYRYISGVAADNKYKELLGKDTIYFKHTDPFLYLVADYDFKYISFENFGRYFGAKKYGWESQVESEEIDQELPTMVIDEFDLFKNILKEKEELTLDEWNDLCN